MKDRSDRLEYWMGREIIRGKWRNNDHVNQHPDGSELDHYRGVADVLTDDRPDLGSVPNNQAYPSDGFTLPLPITRDVGVIERIQSAVRR